MGTIPYHPMRATRGFRRAFLLAQVARAATLAVTVLLVGGCGAKARPEARGVAGSGELRIVTANGVNLRSGPTREASALKQLGIAARVRVLSRGDAEEIEGVHDVWLEVEDGAGARGWVYGGLTAPFDPRAPARYTEPLVRGADDFTTLVALETAIAGMEAEYGRSAELELLRLEAIDSAARRVNDETPGAAARRAWAERHADVLAYFEPGAIHYVSAGAYRDMLERYPASAATETIVWRAAQPPWSHCEDDGQCWLDVGFGSLRLYLERYPEGAYTDSALSRLAEFTDIAAEYACWSEQATRVDPALLGEVRAVLAPVRSRMRETVLGHLRTIERNCGQEVAP